KRGPKTAQSDREVVALIRAILATRPFHSEGHRKVRVRLRQQGVHVRKVCVLRLMRKDPRPPEVVEALFEGLYDSSIARPGRAPEARGDAVHGRSLIWDAQQGRREVETSVRGYVRDLARARSGRMLDRLHDRSTRAG